jgi:Superinfection immunity protein
MLNCPKCGLINPEGAARCDCGFAFVPTSLGKQSPALEMEQSHSMTNYRTTKWIAWFVLVFELIHIPFRFGISEIAGGGVAGIARGIGGFIGASLGDFVIWLPVIALILIRNKERRAQANQTEHPGCSREHPSKSVIEKFVLLSIAALLFTAYLVFSYAPSHGFTVHYDPLSFIGFLIGVGLVLLPSILAAYSDHPKFVWVMLVNIFFSWTIIFWIVSLIWALKGWGNRRNAKGIANAAKAS